MKNEICLKETVKVCYYLSLNDTFVISVRSGILPVNAHVEVNILNLNYIYSFIFYSSKNRFSNDIHYN